MKTEIVQILASQCSVPKTCSGVTIADVSLNVGSFDPDALTPEVTNISYVFTLKISIEILEFI